MIHYVLPVQGCSDLATPEHAWQRKTGDLTIIGCKHYDKTWELKCEETQWNGVVGKCNASGQSRVLRFEEWLCTSHFLLVQTVITFTFIFQWLMLALTKSNFTSWFNMRTGKNLIYQNYMSCNPNSDHALNKKNSFVCDVLVAGIPMELIIIAIIGVVLIISICICVCILGQSLVAKRRQPNHMQPHFNTDTVHTQPAQYGDGGHIMTSSWMCSYPGEKPANPHIWETPLPVPNATQSRGEYNMPANMSHAQDKADEQADDVAESAMSVDVQPTSLLLASTVSDGEYTAPITMNADDQQHAAAVPPQPMPEYTLPIKREMREPSLVQVLAAEDDYLLPSTRRPEPVGAHDMTVCEGALVKNEGNKPESVETQVLLQTNEQF